MAEPSAVIYPSRPPAFAHDKHQQLPCTSCHPATTSSRASDPLSPPADRCDGCHQPPPRAPLAPTAALHFSHQSHHLRGISCAQCHLQPYSEEYRDESRTPLLPTMALCLDCHQAQGGPTGCVACHLSGPDQRLRTALPGGRLIPQDHTSAFRLHHGQSARTAPGRCQSCHEEADCLRCHAGSIRPLAIHPADYLLTHPVEARRGTPDCGQCHRRATFCVGCHHQSGVTDAPGTDRLGVVAPAERLHPLGFVNQPGELPGPQHHRHQARRALNTCVGCHQEETCLRCHSTQSATQLKASPHPPGFRCGRALSTGARGCLKCHRSQDELTRLCHP